MCPTLLSCTTLSKCKSTFEVQVPGEMPTKASCINPRSFCQLSYLTLDHIEVQPVQIMFQTKAAKSSASARFFQEVQTKPQTENLQSNEHTTSDSSTFNVETCLEVLFHLLRTAKDYERSNEKHVLLEYEQKLCQEAQNFQNNYIQRLSLRHEFRQTCKEYHSGQYEREGELMGGLSVGEVMCLVFDEAIDELMKTMASGRPSEELLSEMLLGEVNGLRFGRAKWSRRTPSTYRIESLDGRIEHLQLLAKKIRPCETTAS